jgi:hypothetical protein
MLKQNILSVICTPQRTRELFPVKSYLNTHDVIKNREKWIEAVNFAANTKKGWKFLANVKNVVD